MKIIVSHDVDHITVGEHYKDLIVPKFIIRNIIELTKGSISLKEYLLRWKGIFSNKWQQIEEIMNYNDSLEIKTNFFFGVNNGLGLSYPLKYVKKWVPKVLARGFEAGVHGIDYDDLEKIKKEYTIFSKITTNKQFGIRMHYLRYDKTTLNNLAKAGYLFDCTKPAYENPYKIDNMWEFPLQIMEGWEIMQGARFQNISLEKAKESTLQKVEKAKKAKLKYLSLLFHDRYFDESFKTWIEWYKWIINYLKEAGYEFTTYQKAISELENN